MISFTRIKQLVSGALSKSSSLPDTALVHPVRDWNIGVDFFLLLVGVGAFGAWLTYEHYGSISFGSDIEISEKLNYKRSDVLAALEIYTKREVEYQELLLKASEEPLVPVDEQVPENNQNALIEAGLLGTDGQILPRLPSEFEEEAPPTLDISE